MVPRQPFPCNTLASLIRDISMNDKSNEGIKKEGRSPTGGDLLSAAIRPMSAFTSRSRALAGPQPPPALPGRGSEGLGAKHAVPHCSLPRGGCVRNGIKREIQFPGKNGNKKLWILQEALIS